jgi:hypothetical protein
MSSDYCTDQGIATDHVSTFQHLNNPDVSFVNLSVARRPNSPEFTAEFRNPQCAICEKREGCSESRSAIPWEL